MQVRGTIKGESSQKNLKGLAILVYESGLHGKNLIGSGRVETEDGKFSVDINERLKNRKETKFDFVLGVSPLEKKMQQFPVYRKDAVSLEGAQNLQIQIPDSIIDDWYYWLTCIPVTGHLYKETVLPDGTVMKCPVSGAEVCAIDLVRPVLCPPPHICDLFPEICDPHIDIRDICKIHPEICRGIIEVPEKPGPIPEPDPFLIREINEIRENLTRLDEIKKISSLNKQTAPPAAATMLSTEARSSPLVIGAHLMKTADLVNKLGFEVKPTIITREQLSSSLAIKPTPERLIDSIFGYPIGREVVGCDVTDANGYFSICVPRFRIWRPCRDNVYDIIFRATKVIGGHTVEIYRENIGSARLLPSGGMNVELVTHAPEIPCEAPRPNGICNATNGYAFWGVGALSVAQMQNGLATFAVPAIVRDRPFAGTIDIKACFSTNFMTPTEERFAGYYYQIRAVEMAESASTPPADAPGNGWFTISDEVWSIYTTDDLIDGTPTPITPTTIGTESGLYKIDNKLIFNTNVAGLVLRLNTNRALFGSKSFNGATYYGNGKYAFRIRIFHETSPGTIVEVTTHTDKGAPGVDFPLVIMIDNTPPVAALKLITGTTIHGAGSVVIEGGMSGQCPIYSKGTVSSLGITFDAVDDKYFQSFTLEYLTGHNIHANIDSATYIPPAGPSDYINTGFSNRTAIWNISAIDPCAYQLRLKVWDRRQNGYTGFGETEDTFHLTITS